MPWARRWRLAVKPAARELGLAVGPPARYRPARIRFAHPIVRTAGTAMRWAWPVLAALLAGCSTAPVADVLDFFSPGRIGPEKTPPFGGVCVPQPVTNPAAVPPTTAGPAPPPDSPAPAPPPAGPPPVSPPPPPATPTALSSPSGPGAALGAPAGPDLGPPR